MPAKKVIKPVPPISEWSVKRQGVKALYINPDWGITFGPNISLDVEDDENGGFVGIGIYDPGLNVCYYWSELEGSLHNIPPFIAHNGVTDLYKLRQWGFKVNEGQLVWDTQLVEHILDSSQKMYGLKALTKKWFNEEYPSYEDLTGRKTSPEHVTLDKLPVELVAQYNACDTFWTHKNYVRQLNLLQAA